MGVFRSAPSEYERMSDNTSPRLRNRCFSVRPLVAVALAAAVVTAASLSGLASGAGQKLPWTQRSHHDSEIIAEQRRQASALETIEIAISRARADVALLNARLDEAEDSQQEAANAARSNDLQFDLSALRSSLDEQAERNRNDLRAVNKRLDWLEKIVYGQQATGPVRLAATGRGPSARAERRWVLLHAEKGVAVIAGKGGAIDVTPGFTVPDLGRVAAIRQEGGRWVVVTDKGMTIRER
jgi:hypothetical protein